MFENEQWRGNSNLVAGVATRCAIIKMFTSYDTKPTRPMFSGLNYLVQPVSGEFPLLLIEKV